MSDTLEIVFGLHAVQACLSSKAEDVVSLHVMEGRQDQRMDKIMALAKQHNIAVTLLPRREMDRLCRGRHQGVIARLKQALERNEGHLEEILQGLSEPPFLLILDGVTDPHNLGACLRSADAAGVHAVIVPKDKSAPLNAVAKNVASGAAETVPLVRVTNLARTMKWLQQYGVWIVGAAGETEQSLYDMDLRGPLALAMGAEGSGLRRLTKEQCDHLIQIPMMGSVSSLNVSVASGVCVFEALRQRQVGRR